MMQSRKRSELTRQQTPRRSVTETCCRTFTHYCRFAARSLQLAASVSAVLVRHHTYARATMGQERLSSLALLHMYYAADVYLDQVVELFASL